MLNKVKSAFGGKKQLAVVLSLMMLMGGAVIFDSVKAYAEDSSNQYPPIVQKIADKFGLNLNEVKAVFDQERQDRQVQMESKFEDRLNQAVTDGKLTEDQKKLILTKHQEIQANRDQEKSDEQNLTPEKRKNQMENRRQELKTWASQNGIDVQYLMGGFGIRAGHGFGPR